MLSQRPPDPRATEGVRKGQVPTPRCSRVNTPFKKSRSMQLPREIVAGHGVLPQIAQMARDFGLKGTGVIVWGPHTRALAGEVVAQVLSDAGYDLQTHEAGDATSETVAASKEIATEAKATFLVGVGGGTKIDIAKLAASELGIPFISVPTSCAHDGIASPRATIKVDGRIKSFDAQMPLGVLADTAVLVKAPWRFLAAGCADVTANKTAILDWRLAHRLRNEEFSSSAATMSDMSAEAIISEADVLKRNLEESAWSIVRPIIVSGVSMAIAGSSRPASGSEHLISHALDQIAPGMALHGEQCGVGTIMMMALHGSDWKRIRRALELVGAPTTIRQLGITKEQMVEALTTAHRIRPDRYTILGDQGITAEAAERLMETTGVSG
jgi:glycerol-1-phosphate dehydrogenase [NAD(P)+]